MGLLIQKIKNPFSIISKNSSPIISFYRIFTLIFLSAILNTIILTVSLKSQTAPTVDQKFQLAQTLERAGEIERAEKLYRELYYSDLTNIVYANNFRRILETLKKYDEWIGLLEAMYARRPGDPNMLGELARAYYLSGMEAKAYETWEKIIKTDPDKPFNYRLVSNNFQRARLFEDAIEVLIRGREHFKKPRLFANELANIYYYRRNYGLAVREWLNWVSSDQRYFKIVERNISTFPSDSAVIAEVTQTLEESVADSTDNIRFRNLLAGYYIKNREYDKAFDSYKIIDDKTKALGGRIIEYSDQIFTIGRFAYAASAYSFVLDNYPGGKFAGMARLGLAKSLERSGMNILAVSTDSLRQTDAMGNIQNALTEYDNIIRMHRNSPWAVEAHFRKGILFYDHFFDLDRAVNELNEVRKISPRSKWAWEAALRTGDCFLTKGDIAEAEKHYRILLRAGKPFYVLKTEAEFKLLMNIYYAGNFEKFSEELQSLSVKLPVETNLANDLLSLSMFLDENLTENNNPLKQFARAEFLIKQRKLSESIALLSDLITNSSEHPVIDDAINLKAGLMKEQELYEEAVAGFMELTEKYPQSRFAELGYIEIGKIYEENLKNYNDALKTYEEFLRIYSDSIYIDEIRARLRRLQNM